MLTLFLIISLLLICLIILTTKENFRFFYSSPPTRNMSYDLRCEPRIPRLNMGPWRESTIDYYRPKCLTDI